MSTVNQKKTGISPRKAPPGVSQAAPWFLLAVALLAAVLAVPMLGSGAVAMAQEKDDNEPPSVVGPDALRRFVQGVMSESGGDPRAAYEFYRDAYVLDPGSATILIHMARIALSLDDNKLAARHASEALELDADLATAHMILGTALISMDRRVEATRHFERAVELDSLDAGAVLTLARQYEWNERFEEALREYLRGLDLDAGDSETLLRIATVLGRLGRYEEAIPYLDRLEVQDPRHPSLAITRAWVLDGVGDREHAVRAYRQHLTYFGRDIQARRRLVNDLLVLGRPHEALPEAELLYENGGGAAEARARQHRGGRTRRAGLDARRRGDQGCLGGGTADPGDPEELRGLAPVRHGAGRQRQPTQSPAHPPGDRGFPARQSRGLRRTGTDLHRHGAVRCC
jgi:tetratricopeptide (TPR) repeat protein